MEDDPELTIIHYWSSRFRSALEKTTFPAQAGNLTHFPRECCHHSCVMLKRFLSEKGLGEFCTMSGIHPTEPGGNHHWLQKGNVIVDITADQFGRDKVIVGSVSPWHDSLEGRLLPSTPEADQRKWDGDCIWIGYGKLYALVLPSIDGDD
jgi:hypothetical protein